MCRRRQSGTRCFLSLLRVAAGHAGGEPPPPPLLCSLGGCRRQHCRTLRRAGSPVEISLAVSPPCHAAARVAFAASLPFEGLNWCCRRLPPHSVNVSVNFLLSSSQILPAQLDLISLKNFAAADSLLLVYLLNPETMVV